MELRALVELLQALDPCEALTVHVDSQYVINIFTKWLPVWRSRGMTRPGNKPIVNLDLIEQAARLLRDRVIAFEWVRGHAGHELNERADVLANSAARRALKRLQSEAKLS